MAYSGTGHAGQRSGAVATPPGWDVRLYDGLLARRIAPQTRDALARALGEVGVEAEYLLVLVDTLPGSPTPTHQIGEQFLQRLGASLTRLVAVAATLEVATQSYLTALEASYLNMERHQRDVMWWPAFSGYFPQRDEPLEARLRRCGFAWRHVVESRLPVHMEAILEQLALTLFALSSLPPIGVAPIATLYHGLDELLSALHGEIVPRHILSGSGDPRYPGALASIGRLRNLDASGDTSLASDLAWARATPEWSHISGFLEHLRRA